MEIFAGIRKMFPDGFVIGVRLSPEDKGNFGGIDFDEGLETAKELSLAGADYIHISNWEALILRKALTYISKPYSVKQTIAGRNSLFLFLYAAKRYPAKAI